MALIVQKFGGTSVGTTEKIKKVAERVAATFRQGNQVVVVVSAMGHTTDELIKLCQEITSNPAAREYDQLLMTGEIISTALLAMALGELGLNAVSLTGGQAGILTEDVHSKARIVQVKPERIKKLLAEGKIPIVAGFQGVNSSGDFTTIGRGGSDTSAVVLAAALKAAECDIFTDVEGIFTTDPRIEAEAQKLGDISYEEMLELASLGAAVLHPRAVECARHYGIVLRVRSTFSDNPGTLVKEVKNVENKKPVSGVTCDTGTAMVSMLQVPDKPGMAAKIFGVLGAQKINVDMIIQSQHQRVTNDITFTVNKEDVKKTVEVLEKINQEIGAGGVTSDADVAKVSVVGVGMISQPGVAAQVFEALGEAGINIELISTSEIKISCVVREKEAHKAVKILHKKFGLEKQF